jgi:excisionase family DNA binding protein
VERLLRPKEACQLLGISYSTLLRWIREGKIRAVTTEGGKYRVPYSEIKKYLERREETRAVIYSRVSSADQKRRFGETNKLPNKLRNSKGLQSD